MWPQRTLSDASRVHDLEQAYRDRMRENLLAAMITAALLVTGACLTNELLEAGQSCYGRDGGCEAWGAPVGQIDFADFFQQ